MVELVNHWNQEMQALVKENANRAEEEQGEKEDEEVPNAEVIQTVELIEAEEKVGAQSKDLVGQEKLFKEDEMMVTCKEEVKMPEQDSVTLKTIKSESDLGEVKKCKRCEFICASKEELRKHRNNKHKVVKLSYCDQCDYKCTKKQLVLDHIERTHSDGTETELRTCHKCDFTCNTIRELNYHKYKIHKKKKIFYCNDCDYKCVKRDLYNVHKEKEHGHKLEPEIRNCKKCSFVCTTFTELRMHRDKTHRTTIFYYCKECDYKCTKKEILLDHNDKHGDLAKIETRQCDFCSYTSQSRVSLRLHKNVKHLGQMKCCSECNFTAYRKYTVALHEAKKHGKDKPEKNILCHLCDFRTGDASNLRSHNAAKHDGQMYYCDQCDFKSSYKGSLPHHKKIHDEQSWVQCEHCSYRCARIDNLQTHMEGKHNDISLTSYPCNQCDARRRTKTDLKSHVRSKHGVGIPKRKCGACDYKTISNTNLKKHFTARHTNYRFEIFFHLHETNFFPPQRFACPHCNYTCNWVADLYKHSKGQVNYLQLIFFIFFYQDSNGKSF